MATELVTVPAASVPTTVNAALLPELVERVGGRPATPWLPVEPDPPEPQ